ncbi:MAG: PTS sugar transporter subunit IIA [Magnetococcus sp. DMHC-6]
MTQKNHNMQMAQILTESRVVSDLSVVEKREILAYLAGLFVLDIPGVGKKQILHEFLERERVGTTGIGMGIAIPHAKLPGLVYPLVALGRSVRGVDFDAMDGGKVHLIVALISPLAQTTEGTKIHLEALTAISRLLRSPSNRRRLLEAPDQKALFHAALAPPSID